MNKTFFGILLAVCLLGMALALFSERLSREPEAVKSPQIAAAETQLPTLAASNTPASAPEPIVQEAPLNQPGPANPDGPTLAAEKEEATAARAALAPPAQAEAPIIEASPELPPPTPAETAEIKAGSQLAKPEPEPEKIVPQTATPQEKPEGTPVKNEQKPAPAPAKPDAKAAAAAKPASSANGGQINNFVVFARDKGATIRMGGNTRIKYSSMTLENPNRVVVDLDGAWRFPDKLPIPKNELVSGIRVGKNGDKTRVVIDLKSKPRISRLVEGQNGNSIDVRVDK